MCEGGDVFTPRFLGVSSVPSFEGRIVSVPELSLTTAVLSGGRIFTFEEVELLRVLHTADTDVSAGCPSLRDVHARTFLSVMLMFFAAFAFRLHR